MANKRCGGQLPQFDLNKCAIRMNGGSRIAYITLCVIGCGIIKKDECKTATVPTPKKLFILSIWHSVFFHIRFSFDRVAPELINSIQEIQFQIQRSGWVHIHCIFFLLLNEKMSRQDLTVILFPCVFIYFIILFFSKMSKGNSARTVLDSW